MPPQLKKVEDQVMVITGASSGIGLVTAKLAAARGARVVLAARNERDLRHAPAVRGQLLGAGPWLAGGGPPPPARWRRAHQRRERAGRPGDSAPGELLRGQARAQGLHRLAPHGAGRGRRADLGHPDQAGQHRHAAVRQGPDPPGCRAPAGAAGLCPGPGGPGDPRLCRAADPRCRGQRDGQGTEPGGDDRAPAHGSLHGAEHLRVTADRSGGGRDPARQSLPSGGTRRWRAREELDGTGPRKKPSDGGRAPSRPGRRGGSGALVAAGAAAVAVRNRR